MAKVGIVCEGSHDYCFLLPILDQILSDHGHQDNVFVALQPQVDATSKQVDGGGYNGVLGWPKRNCAHGINQFFQPTLFATSDVYDFVVIHLDGDVADICVDFRNSQFFSPNLSVRQRVLSLDSWIRSLALASIKHADKVFTAVPTLQMESWVLASMRPGTRNLEARNLKKATGFLLSKTYSGKQVTKRKLAGEDAKQAIHTMRRDCVSFEMLVAQVEAYHV